MEKKKAIKIVTATAIAASAFTAVAPAQSEAASSLDTQISKAKSSMKKPYGTYTNAKTLASVSTVSKEISAAKNAESAAIKAINKAKLSAKAKKQKIADLKKYEVYITRAQGYVNGYNAAAKASAALAKQYTELANAVAAPNAADNVAGITAKYTALQNAIKAAKKQISAVYGSTTRTLLTNKFTKPTEDKVAAGVVKVLAEIKAAKANADAYVALANGELKTEDQVNAAIAAKAKVDVSKLDATTKASVAAADAKVAAAAEALKVPVVTSVSALSATKLEVKFNKAVDAATVKNTDGTLKNIITITGIDGQATVNVVTTKDTFELSTDGKTLVVTTDNALSKRYKVIVDGLKTTTGTAVTKYDQVVTFAADTTAPTILGTEKVSASQVKVKFSEPINSLGSVTFKYADGSAVTGVTSTFTSGASEAVFTMDSNVTVNKEIVATIIGAQDKAGNLLTPNPATVSFVKGNKDGVAPTVSSITQTGAKTFAVKFSEELLTSPTVQINGTTVDSASVVKDKNDATTYNVTAPAALDGATTVAVTSFTDLSGENGTAVSKVVTFVKDTVAPKVVSSNVVADSTDNKQYLELTFDKDVELSSATVAGIGSYVKDYVTTAATVSPATVAYKDANNKKVIRVALATFLSGKDVEGAVYSLDLTLAGVTSGSGVSADTTKVSFTRGKDGVASNANVVSVTGVAQGSDNNKVNVTFDQAVDGATATNVANYSIAGAVVESVTLQPVSGGTQVAVLNLKAGSNGFTGIRNISVSGVKALGSTKVMNTYTTNTVSLNENIVPVVTSAKLTATDKITLTFSEAVSDATAKDFEVLIGGQSQATPDTASVSVTSANTVTFTISSIDAAELAKGISLKALSTLDITDAAGNKLSVPANITVSN